MTLHPATPAHLHFYFDPQCPFAWRTALWAREARKVRPLTITWHVFSLEVVNRAEGAEPDYVNGNGWTALRTLVLVRRQPGNEGIEKLYLALGNAHHGRKENINQRSTVEQAVESVGLNKHLVEQALDDESTVQDVLQDHTEAVERYKAFGVPTIALENTDIGYYGPVIIEVPRGEEAGELWDHMAWALQNNNIYELKRSRNGIKLPRLSDE